MPYSRITPCHDVRAALYYARGGDDNIGHDGGERNLLIGSVGLLPESVMTYEEQFEQLLQRASSRNTTEARRIILSFSKDEIDPDDPQSANKALQITQDVLNTHYSGFPAAIFIQKDGKGGCIHVHAITSNVNAIDNRGFTRDEMHHSYLRRAVDEVSANYIVSRQQTTPTADKITQYERHLREVGGYVWKDDLKERIAAAAAAAKNRDEFVQQLQKNGVSATFKTSKKQGDYILYELQDTSKFDGKIPQNLKCKSYKLGSDYDIAAISKPAPSVSVTPVAPVRDITEPAEEKPVTASVMPYMPRKHRHNKKIQPAEETAFTEPTKPTIDKKAAAAVVVAAQRAALEKEREQLIASLVPDVDLSEMFNFDLK